MLWLYLAIIAYLINAAVSLIDKHLLASSIPRPFSYAFGVAVLSSAAVFLLPFGINWYGPGFLILAVASGFAFFTGLILLYRVIKASDISVGATMTGTFGAVFTFIFSFLFLNQSVNAGSLIAFLLLVCGILFLGRAQKNVLWLSIASGALFGLYFVLMKYAFNVSDYVNGLFWTRVGFVGTALATLVLPRVRQELASSFRFAPPQSRLVFVSNKLLSGAGFLVLYLAVRMGDVSLINAMLGLQFMFVFILSLILKDRLPAVRESLNNRILIQKITGIALVIAGFAVLFLNK